jgi:hypothetical protein
LGISIQVTRKALEYTVIAIQGELRPQPNQENLEPPASLKAQRSPSKKGKYVAP